MKSALVPLSSSLKTLRNLPCWKTWSSKGVATNELVCLTFSRYLLYSFLLIFSQFPPLTSNIVFTKSKFKIKSLQWLYLVVSPWGWLSLFTFQSNRLPLLTKVEKGLDRIIKLQTCMQQIVDKGKIRHMSSIVLQLLIVLE